MAIRCSQASAGASGRQRDQARKARRYASCTQSSAAARSRRSVTRVPNKREYVSSYSRSKSSRTPAWYSLPTLAGDYLIGAHTFRASSGSKVTTLAGRATAKQQREGGAVRRPFLLGFVFAVEVSSGRGRLPGRRADRRWL